MGKKKRQKGEQRQGVCVYCGNQGPITDDHVFPQLIFRVLDEQMLTVPACAGCQQIKSLGDRDLRTLILMDIGGSTHPDALALTEHMLRESNIRLRSWIRKQLEASEDVDLLTDTGLHVGKATAIEFTIDRVITSQEMVARGLFYHERHAMLSPSTVVDVQYLPWHVAPSFAKRMSEKAPMSIREKGNKVAAWSFHEIQDQGPEAVAIHIIYNNWVYFFVTTGSAAEWVKRQRQETQPRQGRGVPEGPQAPRSIIVPRDPRGRPIIPPQ